jgi:hypothetical protein
MAGLGPAIHVIASGLLRQQYCASNRKAWMPATSAGMTGEDQFFFGSAGLSSRSIFAWARSLATRSTCALRST